jgi:hypothetical protein
LAYDVAQLSSLADELMEVLNEKSVQDIENEPLVRPFMNTLGSPNAGQGSGSNCWGPWHTRTRYSESARG